MKGDLHVNDPDWREFGKERANEEEDCKKNGWNSKEAQDRRFGVFKHEMCQGDWIVDVGCGTGDLYRYLTKNSNIQFKYTGFDLSEDLIKIAKDRNPEISKSFMVFDILEDKYDYSPEFDIIVASGIFSERKYKSIEYLDTMISQMVKRSKRVVAFNLLSTFGDEIKEGSRYWSPSEVIMIIQKYTKRFKILHDYAPYDFTCVLYVP